MGDGRGGGAGDGDGRRAPLEGVAQRVDDVARASGVGDGDGHVPGAEQDGVGDGEVGVVVGVCDQADAQQFLCEVLADEGGGADAVDVDAAGGREGVDGGGQLGQVESGGGVREGLRLLVGQFGDDVGQGVVDGYAGGDGGGLVGLLPARERGQGQAQVAVAGVAEEAGGAHDGGLAGAGAFGEGGDGEPGAPGGIGGDGFGDDLRGPCHGRPEPADPGPQGGGGGSGGGGEGYFRSLAHL